MRTIRNILLTEYIGAILIAVLIADSLSAFFTTLVVQISYRLYVTKDSLPRDVHRLWSPYSVLETLIRIGLYLLSAYLLARWLYPSTMAAEGGENIPENQKNEGTT